MTDKRVVDFLRTALRKLNQDWPRSVNLRTPLWSRLTMFCHPSIPTLLTPCLVHEKLVLWCAQWSKGNTNFRPLNWEHNRLISLSLSGSDRLRLHCVLTSPLSCTLFLYGTTTEWLVKSRKINITPYQWLTNELSISWEQLWESLTKIDQDPSTFEHRFDHV